MVTLTFVEVSSEQHEVYWQVDTESRGWGGGLAWLVVCWAG